MKSKGYIAFVSIAAIGSVAAAPIIYKMFYIKNNFDPNKPMPRSAAIRGAYINSGSKDIGPDKEFFDSMPYERPSQHKHD
eukprot:CAMPEP_0175078126 /NCGR_PEP_ID=MMETSP0052_2-20121109/23891_1 /TAXON_ID=51329 ORGANISM="Polytomella parva, Strain SAG 63-3" /NCGR_SAMPLE_ID=MMETSP0052_2 /ASSEMBLY_ACC=CAM_ASM_000194 /LENGTH=79 /DNA_ID=CAMNT_0016347905 /DNA_START=30 /DNA_END=269 /DNA_ORIENTATION=+